MHNTRGAGRQKRCTIRTCLRLSGPLHRTSTLSHGGEATGTRNREPYPCPRQRDGSAHTRAARTRPPHPAPVAQWIEQAPSKRLAAGSSPAGGASLRPPIGRAFLLLRARFARHGEAPDTPPMIKGAVRGCPATTGVFAGGRVAYVSHTCRIRVEVLGERHRPPRADARAPRQPPGASSGQPALPRRIGHRVRQHWPTAPHPLGPLGGWNSSVEACRRRHGGAGSAGVVFPSAVLDRPRLRLLVELRQALHLVRDAAHVP